MKVDAAVQEKAVVIERMEPGSGRWFKGSLLRRRGLWCDSDGREARRESREVGEGRQDQRCMAVVVVKVKRAPRGDAAVDSDNQVR